MNPTITRDRIPTLAATKGWANALTVAEQIDDPWYRCQALAIAADYIPDRNRQLKTLYDALYSADQMEDHNRITTVSAWPIGRMLKLGFETEADREISRLLEVISHESSPVRRADATNCLLEQMSGCKDSSFWRVYDVFFAACTSYLKSGKRNSKGESLLARWAGYISRRDSRRGKQLLDAIKGPVHKLQAQQAIESSCITCGYDLRGSKQSTSCPECGEVI